MCDVVGDPPTPRTAPCYSLTDRGAYEMSQLPVDCAERIVAGDIATAFRNSDAAFGYSFAAPARTSTRAASYNPRRTDVARPRMTITRRRAA